jgi:hypothetical protein
MKKPTLKQLCKKYTKIHQYTKSKQIEFIQFKKDLIKQTMFLNKKKKFKIKMTERMFYVLNDIKKIIKCEYCNSIEMNFGTLKQGYKSKSCGRKECRMKKTSKTNLKRYGVTNVYASEEIKKKLKATWLKNMGVLNPYQSEKVKEKIKQTNLRVWGIDYPSKLKIIKKKSQKTCLKNYGVKFSMQSELVKDKSKKTNLKRYGFECSLQNEEVKQKIKDTNLRKYNKEYANQSEEVKSKIKQTNLKRYGVECTLSSKKIRNKIAKTNLRKYGTKFPSSTKQIKDKLKQTNLLKFGCENPQQNKIVREKTDNTNLKRYGFKTTLQNENVKEKSRQFYLKNYGVTNVSQVPEFHEKQQKSAHKFKHYKINKSGTILLLQGYEPKVIDNLLNTYKESEIIVDRNKIPKFMYKTEDNKNHRYFPDIYIPKENLIIEVKSEWTKTLKPEIQELKKKSILKNKFKFKLIVPKNNKELENISLIKTL